MYNIRIIRVPGEGKSNGKTFKEIMVKTPNLMKNINLHIQKVQQIANRINKRNSHPEKSYKNVEYGRKRENLEEKMSHHF